MAYNSTIDKATDDILIYGNTAKDGTGTSYVPIVDSDGQLQVDVLSSALPTGASTSAKQDTIIGHLDGVEGLLTTIDADTGNISTKIDTIAGAVSGTEMQVDVLTMPTTTVQATNLDIRDIDAATDDITIHGDVGVVDQLDLTNSNPLVTAVVDANGDQITSFGGGTQYTEADTDASITGTAMMMEGAGNALVPAQGTTTDGLLVNLGSNNDVTVTSGTITTITNPVTVTATNLDVQSGGADLATSAQAAAIQTAVELIDDTVKVLGTDTYTEATSKGLVMGAVRRDADTTLANTTNEFAPLQVDANGYLKVEIFDGGGSHTVDNGGTFAVQVDGSALTALQLIDDTVFSDDAAFTPGTSKVNAIGLMADETSTDSVDEGDIGIPRMTTDRKQIATLYPSSGTTDGVSVANFNSGDTFTALTNTAQVIKASAGNFYGYYIYNPNSAATYVMLYNTAAASVTVGTTTPAMVFCIPATSGANLSLTYPIPFTNAGWSIAAATTGGGNSAPATALEAMIFYK